MVHIPQWNVVVVLWNRSQLWCIHDQVTTSGLHVVNTIEIDSKNPIVHMCMVKLPQRTELWATQGDKKITIIGHLATGISCDSTLACTIDRCLLFCHFIICLHFNSSKTGNSMARVWVSFNRRPHLVCWDAETRSQIHSVIKTGKQLNNYLYEA